MLYSPLKINRCNRNSRRPIPMEADTHKLLNNSVQPKMARHNSPLSINLCTAIEVCIQGVFSDASVTKTLKDGRTSEVSVSPFKLIFHPIIVHQNMASLSQYTVLYSNVRLNRQTLFSTRGNVTWQLFTVTAWSDAFSQRALFMYRCTGQHTQIRFR